MIYLLHLSWIGEEGIATFSLHMELDTISDSFLRITLHCELITNMSDAFEHKLSALSNNQWIYLQ
jgi:hypothetical protein